MDDIESLIAQYLSYSSYIHNYTDATVKGSTCTLKRFFRENHPKAIDDVDRDMVEDWLIQGRVRNKWQPATYIAYYKHLNWFFAWLEKKWKIEHNFIKEIDKPKLGNPLPKRLSLEEAEELLLTVRRFKYTYKFEKTRNYSFIALMIFTGLRKNEVTHLQMSDIDMKKGLVFVMHGKGRKDRIVPISSRLHSILIEYLAERKRLNKQCQYFFTTAQYDIPMGEHCIKLVIERLRKALKLKFSAHSLRHTFATLMLEGGCDIYTLSKMMGHTKVTTTAGYLACSTKLLTRSIEKHPLN